MFDHSIFDQPSICVLVKFVWNQNLLHLFEMLVPVFYEQEVKDFYYTIKFSEYGLNLITMVQGIEFFLEEMILKDIFNLPIVQGPTISLRKTYIYICSGFVPYGIPQKIWTG